MPEDQLPEEYIDPESHGTLGPVNLVAEGNVTTPAGSSSVTGAFVDATGASARFNSPDGLVVDLYDGSYYVADIGNNRVRKVTTANVVSTFAGNGTATSTDGTGTGATVMPIAITIDQATRNIYFTESYRVRKITAAGVVTTIAGGSSTGFADGTGTSALFNNARGICFDPVSGNLYVSESSNRRIRKVTPGGVVTTHAGSGTQAMVNGTGTGASFYSPRGLVCDKVGNLYVCDYSAIRKITPAGVVTTVAGNLSQTLGNTEGPLGTNRVNDPYGITYDSATGHFYITDFNSRIRRLVPDDTGGLSAYSGTTTIGTSDGNASTVAAYQFASGITHDPLRRYIYLTDYHRIRRIAQNPEGTGLVAPHIGNATSASDTGGTGTAARFGNPEGAVVAPDTNLYFCDTTYHRVRKVTPDGVVTNLAGTGTTGNGDGTGTAASFNTPRGITADASGNLYVADAGNHRIRKITPAGVVTTLAGSTQGFNDATGTAAQFNAPARIVCDKSTGDIYLTDPANWRVRKITAAGVVTTLAGTSTPGTSDGIGSAARFTNPFGITLAKTGDLYVTDNQTVRRVTTGGAVSTVAGVAGSTGSSDAAPGTLSGPIELTVGANGDLFIVDAGNFKIRRLPAIATNTGTVLYDGLSTFSGTGTSAVTNGSAGAATYQNPVAIAAAPNGDMYISDGSSFRKIFFYYDPYTTTVAAVTTSQGICTDGAGTVYVTRANLIVRIIGTTATNWAGQATSGTGNGTGTAAFFNAPKGLCYNPVSKMLYVADTGNNLVRAIDPATAVVSTLPVSVACQGITVDPATATLYVTDMVGHRVAKITGLNSSSYIAGTNATTGTTDGAGNVALFNTPTGIAWDSTLGACVVIDRGTNRIRKVMPDGTTSTLLAGGAPTTAYHFARDTRGNYFVPSNSGLTINRFNINAGVVPGYALATGLGIAGLVNGGVNEARFDAPFAVAYDQGGQFLVSDTNNSVVRRLTMPVYEDSTIAGLETVTGADVNTALVKAPRAVSKALVAPANGSFSLSAGNSAGQKFQISTAQTLVGLEANAQAASGTVSAFARIYSATGTLLASASTATSWSNFLNVNNAVFATPVELAANTTYIAVWYANPANAADLVLPLHTAGGASNVDFFLSFPANYGTAAGDVAVTGSVGPWPMALILDYGRAPGAPTVTFPNASGLSISGQTTLTWNAATDPDGEAVSYDVEYTTNNGGAWTRIATNRAGTSMPYDFTAVSPSSSGRIRVRGFDGYAAGVWDQSDNLFTFATPTSKSDSDTATATDDAGAVSSPATPVSSSDTVTATEAEALVKIFSSSDTITAVDAESIVQALSGSDTVTVADSEAPRSITSADTVPATENQSLVAQSRGTTGSDLQLPPTTGSWSSSVYAGYTLGKTFTVSANLQVSGLQWYTAASSTSNVSPRLYSGNTLIAAGNAVAVSSPTGSWWQFNFTSPVSLTAATTYTAAFYIASGTSQNNLYAETSSSVTANGKTLTDTSGGVSRYTFNDNPPTTSGLPDFAFGLILVKTPTVPVVTYPNGGENISGILNITWTPSTDPDGDAITYDVGLSTNNGGAWTTLVTNLAGASYSYNTSAATKGSQALIRVRASDGVNVSAYDQSDAAFTIADQVVSSSDTVTATDTHTSLTLASSDTVAATDTTGARTTTGTDTASGTDTTGARTISGADTVAAAETNTLATVLSSPDTVTAADTNTVRLIAASDTVTASEANLAINKAFTAADVIAAAEAVTLAAVLSAADPVSTVDAEVPTTRPISSTDTIGALEASSAPTVTITKAETVAIGEFDAVLRDTQALEGEADRATRSKARSKRLRRVAVARPVRPW